MDAAGSHIRWYLENILVQDLIFTEKKFILSSSKFVDSDLSPPFFAIRLVVPKNHSAHIENFVKNKSWTKNVSKYHQIWDPASSMKIHGMVSLIWEIYSLVNQVFQSFLIEPYCVLEQLQQRNPDATKEGGREKKKKEKPLDRSSTKGFSSSQSLNLTSQTKWIPFAWLLVGPLWWWKRIECIWWKTNVHLGMSGDLWRI